MAQTKYKEHPKTHRQMMDEFTLCQTDKDVAEFLKREITRYVRVGHYETWAEAERVLVGNINYLLGYYSNETCRKWRKLLDDGLRRLHG